MNPSTPGVTPLRQRMLDDMRMRKLEPKTQACQHRTTFPHFRRSKFPHPVAVPVLSRRGVRRPPFEGVPGRV